jgi:SAM-dependent methyltransferase
MSIVLALIVFALLGTFAYGAYSAAPWVPSWKKDVERAMGAAHIKPGETFVDLGCGDGRLVEAAASRGAHAIGYEVSLAPFIIAKIRQWRFHGPGTMIIRFSSFWSASLKSADVVYIFLLKDQYPRLQQKFLSELRPDARVITYVWPFDRWTPSSQAPSIDGRSPIFVYTMSSVK